MKNKYPLVFIVLCLLSFKVSAQESIIGDINYALLDRYIQAANEYYPRKKVVDGQQEIAKAGIGAATVSYLDMFTVNYFYRPNDQPTLATGATASPYTVNGFQYGINFNLGSFLQKPYMVKRAKAEYRVAKLQSEDYKITLASEVKKRYYTYVQMLSELKIRTQKAQDNKSVADNARRRFERGEIPLELYNSSRVELANSSSEKIQVEVNYLTAKDALEEIVGKKLSEFK